MRPPGETGHTSGGKRAPRTYWKIIRQSELRAQEGDGERRENARVIPEIYYRPERGADLLLEFRESKWKGVDFRRLDGERGPPRQGTSEKMYKPTRRRRVARA